MDPKRLLVDGANIVHAWPELEALLPRDVQAARERLVAQLQWLHDSGAAIVQVVFDGRGPEPVVESRAGTPPLHVIYTATAQTADEVIERLVTQAKDPSRCLVATADRLERQTIEAAGAQAMSPDELFAWVQRVAGRQSSSLKARQRANDAVWPRRPNA